MERARGWKRYCPGARGCGEIDSLTGSDNDGVPDCMDQCPTDPDKHLSGICICFVSDVDSDGDGVPDCNEACPLNPVRWENYGTRVNSPFACLYSDIACGPDTCLPYCFNARSAAPAARSPSTAMRPSSLPAN